MTQEEAEREKQSHDGREGSISAYRRLSRTSTDKNMHNGGLHVPKAVAEDTSEDAVAEKTSMAASSSSPEKTNGPTGATLPVVDEDGEANSREESMHNEKLHGTQPKVGQPTDALSDEHPPSTLLYTLPRDDALSENQLPPIPHLARLSMTETLAAQTGRVQP